MTHWQPATLIEGMKARGGCHSSNFAKAELEQGDDMIREADHLTAEAIRVGGSIKEDRCNYPFINSMKQTIVASSHKLIMHGARCRL